MESSSRQIEGMDKRERERQRRGGRDKIRDDDALGVVRECIE